MSPDALAAAGHYSIARATNGIAAGAASDSEVFQFRWTSTTKLAVVYEIGITGMRATTAFAAGPIDIKGTKARAWTVDGSGGNDLTPTADVAQMRTNMGDSVVGAIRIADTAALTAGTKTLDSTNFAVITTHSSAGVGSATPIIGSIYLAGIAMQFFKPELGNGESPLVLAANEGFVIRCTVPATGVWSLGVRVRWAEIKNQRY